MSTRERFVCNEDTHYWPEMDASKGEPDIGASCRCGLRRWKIEVYFPKPASAEEMAAFMAEVMEGEIPPDFDREEGLRRWLS